MLSKEGGNCACHSPWLIDLHSAAEEKAEEKRLVVESEYSFQTRNAELINKYSLIRLGIY